MGMKEKDICAHWEKQVRLKLVIQVGRATTTGVLEATMSHWNVRPG